MRVAAFSLFAVTSVAVASPLLFPAPPAQTTKASIPEVKAQLLLIQDDANVLLKGVQSTDGLDYFADLALLGPAQKLQKDITTGYQMELTLTPADVSEADAQVFFDIFQDIEPAAKALCLRAAELEPNFRKAGVCGIVQSQIKTIPDQVNQIGSATIALAPASFQEKGKALLEQYRADLRVCSDAYPNTK